MSSCRLPAVREEGGLDRSQAPVAVLVHVELVAHIEEVHIELVDSLEVELVQDRDAVVGAAGLLGLDIVREGLAGLVGFRRIRIVPGVGAEETEGGEEVDLRLRVLLQQGLDAVVDAAALGGQLPRVVVVVGGVVLPAYTPASSTCFWRVYPCLFEKPAPPTP